MRFRRKGTIEPEPPIIERETHRRGLQAHKYSIRFDISPGISYLNDHLCRLLAELLPLFEGFPQGVWVSHPSVEEGLDFCRVNFWAFAEEPDAIKEFSIWFQAFFRNEGVIALLERFIKHSLEDPDKIEVTLVDWARAHVTEEEVRHIVEGEQRRA